MFAFYRIANDWANPPYEVPMTNIYSNWRAIKAELEEPEDDYRMALAQIIRVAAMQRVTDIQGPIPYRTMENNDDLTGLPTSRRRPSTASCSKTSTMR